MKIRTSVGVAALAVAVLTGCETPKGNLTGQSGQVDNGASSAPATGGAKAATPSRATIGHSIRITGDNGLTAAVTAVSVKRTKIPASSYGDKPKNGTFVVVKVLIAVTAGDYDFNPLYFKYQSADGTTYDGSSGLTAGFTPALDAGRLHAGQKTGGVVAFDAPLGKGVLQLTDPVGGIVGEWTL